MSLICDRVLKPAGFRFVKFGGTMPGTNFCPPAATNVILVAADEAVLAEQQTYEAPFGVSCHQRDYAHALLFWIAADPRALGGCP